MLPIEVGKFDNFHSRAARRSVISRYMKFIRNNNARNAFVSHTTSRDASPGCSSRRFGTAASQFVYMPHCPACIPSKILHLVERADPRVSPEKPSSQITFVRATSPDAAAGGGRRAEQEELNSSEQNKRGPLYTYIRPRLRRYLSVNIKFLPAQ